MSEAPQEKRISQGQNPRSPSLRWWEGLRPFASSTSPRISGTPAMLCLLRGQVPVRRLGLPQSVDVVQRVSNMFVEAITRPEKRQRPEREKRLT